MRYKRRLYKDDLLKDSIFFLLNPKFPQTKLLFDTTINFRYNTLV